MPTAVINSIACHINDIPSLKARHTILYCSEYTCNKHTRVKLLFIKYLFMYFSAKTTPVVGIHGQTSDLIEIHECQRT